MDTLSRQMTLLQVSNWQLELDIPSSVFRLERMFTECHSVSVLVEQHGARPNWSNWLVVWRMLFKDELYPSSTNVTLRTSLLLMDTNQENLFRLLSITLACGRVIVKRIMKRISVR